MLGPIVAPAFAPFLLHAVELQLIQPHDLGGERACPSKQNARPEILTLRILIAFLPA
jgi:hypothetical protein